MYWNVELECGHKVIHQSAGVPADYLVCCECPKATLTTDVHTVRIYAVDIREWKVQCHDCTYARWCGYGGEKDANALADVHSQRRAHNTGVSLRIHPARLALFRNGYGRRRWPKRFILQGPNPIKASRNIQPALPPGKDTNPYVNVHRSADPFTDDPPPF